MNKLENYEIKQRTSKQEQNTEKMKPKQATRDIHLFMHIMFRLGVDILAYFF